jgi:hypothetical protein
MNDYCFGFLKSFKIDSIIDKAFDRPNVLGLSKGTSLHFGELLPKSVKKLCTFVFPNLIHLFHIDENLELPIITRIHEFSRCLT